MDKKTSDNNERLALIIAGVNSAPTILVEFRGQQLDLMKWVDKTTGKARQMQKLNIAAEYAAEAGGQLQLEVMPPRGSETVDLLPYSKGDKVWFTIANYESGQKGTRGRVVSHGLFRGVSE